MPGPVGDVALVPRLSSRNGITHSCGAAQREDRRIFCLLSHRRSGERSIHTCLYTNHLSGLVVDISISTPNLQQCLWKEPLSNLLQRKIKRSTSPALSYTLPICCQRKTWRQSHQSKVPFCKATTLWKISSQKGLRNL